MCTHPKVESEDIDICLRRWAKRDPEKLVLADSHQRLTWQTFDRRLNQIANALIEEGLKPNDRIAILGRNSVEYALLFLGGLRAGLCMTPLSTLASPETLRDMINDSGAKLLFVSKSSTEMIDPVVGQLNTLLPKGLRNLDYECADRKSLFSFFSNEHTNEVSMPISLSQDFNLIYSSGTTGTPKGILHDRRYRAREREGLAAWGVSDTSRTLVSTPLYSNTTLFLFVATLANGGAAFLMEKFNTKQFLELSESERITHAVLVPVQYERLLNDPALDQTNLSNYLLKLSTSAPLHQQTKEQILKRWPAGGLLEIYGMTEGGVACFLKAQERPDKLDTVGQPGEGCDLKIINNKGEELPQGEIGEVIGHSENMMQGYVNCDEATKEASWFDRDGRRYHKSGDIGWLDDEGFLHLLDRKKDMIISGGFNVYAIDLEKALLNHLAVVDAAVVAAPSKQWGETPVAFIVLKTGTKLSAESILEQTNATLGKAQRISAIYVLDRLPRSPIGKILKREIRDQYLPQINT